MSDMYDWCLYTFVITQRTIWHPIVDSFQVTYLASISLWLLVRFVHKDVQLRN